ncbi:hypothetical protein D3C85_1224060 [compost metagenome]
MKLIEKFYCIQTEIFGDGSEKIKEGIVEIKNELIRPSINFLNSDGISVNQNHKYIARLEQDPFTKEQMCFFEENYGITLKKHLRSPEYLTSSLNHIHPLYKSSADLILIDDEGKMFLIIQFNRWGQDFQPRGAGEDSLGEDVYYIHGIWEDPLLTDEIIAKIKGHK